MAAAISFTPLRLFSSSAFTCHAASCLGGKALLSLCFLQQPDYVVSAPCRLPCHKSEECLSRFHASALFPYKHTCCKACCQSWESQPACLMPPLQCLPLRVFLLSSSFPSHWSSFLFRCLKGPRAEDACLFPAFPSQGARSFPLSSRRFSFSAAMLPPSCQSQSPSEASFLLLSLGFACSCLSPPRRKSEKKSRVEEEVNMSFDGRLSQGFPPHLSQWHASKQPAKLSFCLAALPCLLLRFLVHSQAAQPVMPSHAAFSSFLLLLPSAFSQPPALPSLFSQVTGLSAGHNDKMRHAFPISFMPVIHTGLHMSLPVIQSHSPQVAAMPPHARCFHSHY